MLVIAKRTIDEMQYMQWVKRYDEVRMQNSEKQQIRLNELYEELEQELTYLGCTAIEDKL